MDPTTAAALQFANTPAGQQAVGTVAKTGGIYVILITLFWIFLVLILVKSVLNISQGNGSFVQGSGNCTPSACTPPSPPSTGC